MPNRVSTWLCALACLSCDDSGGTNDFNTGPDDIVNTADGGPGGEPERPLAAGTPGMGSSTGGDDRDAGGGGGGGAQSGGAQSGGADAGGTGGSETGGPGRPPGRVESGSVEVLYDDVAALAFGLSNDIRFQVPEDAVGLTIFALGDASDVYVVEHLEDPDGVAVVTDDPPGGIGPFDQLVSPWPGQFKSPNRAVHTESLATLLVPNNPEVELKPGEWMLRLAGKNARSGQDSSGVFPLIIQVKRAPRPPVRGTLKLNLYFTGARGWTAESAPRDADFQAALFRMSSFYSEVGIEIETVSHHDVDSEFRVIDSFLGEPDNELGRLFELGKTEQGVNLFFVERFAGGMGGAIGGIAGAIPGPSGAGLGGTRRSGVCVATNVDPDPQSIGHVMGHEVGHYLGLFHTSEVQIPGINDPVPDTPEGRASSDNLMFPTVTRGAASLSPQQGQVIRGNPTIAP